MEDDDLVPISALQHFLYCPRQCGLIHIERLWEESQNTAEGRLLHEKADTLAVERRKGVRVVTAMPLAHTELGLFGVADVVEFHHEECYEQAVPVEYKRGRPKAHRADEVQLCAQALCLEFMLKQPVPLGFLFYAKVRRRQEIVFDSALRALTEEVASSTRAMLSSARTPLATYEAKRCDSCSLIALCQPRLLTCGRSVERWLREELKN
jgi:CRISPR-associated exonuclease Cas4